jgi:hypothetical protein
LNHCCCSNILLARWICEVIDRIEHGEVDSNRLPILRFKRLIHIGWLRNHIGESTDTSVAERRRILWKGIVLKVIVWSIDDVSRGVITEASVDHNISCTFRVNWLTTYRFYYSWC